MVQIIEIKQYLDQKYPQNKGFFVFGSWVYGTQNNTSDIDLVVIEDQLNGQTSNEKYDIQFISEPEFLNQVKKCDIRALEGVFGPYSLFKNKIEFKIDWNLLRSSISQKSSHSFVKAKKKIEIDKNLKMGQKSLFHAIRILEFGKQMAIYKCINDFCSSNHHLKNILSYHNWEDLNKVYKPIYNQLHSEFKILCPK